MTLNEWFVVLEKELKRINTCSYSINDLKIFDFEGFNDFCQKECQEYYLISKLLLKNVIKLGMKNNDFLFVMPESLFFIPFIEDYANSTYKTPVYYYSENYKNEDHMVVVVYDENLVVLFDILLKAIISYKEVLGCI